MQPTKAQLLYVGVVAALQGIEALDTNRPLTIQRVPFYRCEVDQFLSIRFHARVRQTGKGEAVFWESDALTSETRAITHAYDYHINPVYSESELVERCFEAAEKIVVTLEEFYCPANPSHVHFHLDYPGEPNARKKLVEVLGNALFGMRGATINRHPFQLFMLVGMHFTINGRTWSTTVSETLEESEECIS